MQALHIEQARWDDEGWEESRATREKRRQERLLEARLQRWEDEIEEVGEREPEGFNEVLGALRDGRTYAELLRA